MPSVLDHIIQQAKDSPAVIRAELVLEQLGDGWTVTQFHLEDDTRVVVIANDTHLVWFAEEGWLWESLHDADSEGDFSYTDDPFADATEIVKAVKEAMEK